MERENLLTRAHAYFKALDGRIPEENGYPYTEFWEGKIIFAHNPEARDAFIKHQKSSRFTASLVPYTLIFVLFTLASVMYLCATQTITSFKTFEAIVFTLFAIAFAVLVYVCYRAWKNYQLKTLFAGRIIVFFCYGTLMSCKQH